MFNKASFKTCCLIPPESVEIALDALYTIEITKDGPYIFEGEGQTDNRAERYDAFDVNEEDHRIFKELLNQSTQDEKKGGKANTSKQGIEMTNRSHIATKRSNAPLADTNLDNPAANAKKPNTGKSKQNKKGGTKKGGKKKSKKAKE